MAGGGEGAPVAGSDEDAGSGPDADSRVRGQDLGSRVGVQVFFDSSGLGLALVEEGGQGSRQSWDAQCGRLGAGNGGDLLVQGGEDVLDQPLDPSRVSTAGCCNPFPGPVPAAGGPGEAGRRDGS